MAKQAVVLKEFVTLLEMSKMLGMSRARFYQLLGTVFPKPLRSDKGRPYYDKPLQEVCLRVKATNQGIDGQPVQFYGRAKNRLVLCQGQCGRSLPESDFPYNEGERIPICKDCYQSDEEKEKRKQISAANNKLKRYNITIGEYHTRAARQCNRCAICGEFREMLHVDHNHTTGDVRGLLCPNCNKGLGFFKDDVTRLWNAIAYIEITKSPEAENKD